jgi:hypothetical protein
MANGWGVSITIYGQQILHIGDDCLSGIADLDPWRSTVRGCAEHLMSFICTESDGQPVASADARDAALAEIHAFLLGDGPLEGVWYGDMKSDVEVDAAAGRYWWRRVLRTTIAASKEPAQ